MSIFFGLQPLEAFRRLRPGLLFVLLGAGLAACGGGGGDDGGGSEPPPGPPPPPPPGTPPLSATAINVDAGQQIGANRWGDGNTSTGGQGLPIAGLDCFDNLPQTFHLHTHLAVFLNGEQLAVPASIGIVDTSPTNECHYPLHTHDRSGLLHAEAASQATFTLGQVFQVWGQPLSSSDIAGLTGLPVTVYVTDNGVVSVASGDLGAIELRSRRLITVVVGTGINEIPNYTWTGN